MRYALVAIVWCGCWTEAAPVATGPTAPGSTVATPAPTTPATVKLELVEDAPSTLPGDTTVYVKNVMYAHLSDSKNLSRVTLIVTHGMHTAELQLERLHGDPTKQAASVAGFGWSFTLEMADPYQRPPRAIVHAVRP